MIILPAVSTHDAIAAFSRGVPKAIAADAQEVVVDASGLVEFDSSALALLLECRRQALQAGKTFAVRSMPERMRQLAGVYGIAELIPASSDPRPALPAHRHSPSA
jgi:phospholipid transport system transporter-binding protein